MAGKGDDVGIVVVGTADGCVVEFTIREDEVKFTGIDVGRGTTVEFIIAVEFRITEV